MMQSFVIQALIFLYKISIDKVICNYNLFHTKQWAIIITLRQTPINGIMQTELPTIQKNKKNPNNKKKEYLETYFKKRK